MKKTKLIFATAPLTVFAMTMPLVTACNNGEQLIEPTITVEHGTATCTKIWLNEEFRILYTPTNGWTLKAVSIIIGDKTLVYGADDGYTIEDNVIIVKPKAVTSNKISITITARQIEEEEVLAKITEPTNAVDRAASSIVTGDLTVDKSGSAPSYSGSVRYMLPFNGTFEYPEDMTGHTIGSIVTLVYNDNGNKIPFTFQNPIDMIDKTKFKLGVYNDFSGDSSQTYHIWDIPGNYDADNVEVESVKIIDSTDSQNIKTFVCEKAYTARIVPNVYVSSRQSNIYLKFEYGKWMTNSENQTYYVVNTPAALLNKGGETRVYINNSTSKNGKIKPKNGWELYGDFDKYNKFYARAARYQEFEVDSSVTTTTTDTIGFNVDDNNGTIYFKKPVDQLPEITAQAMV